MQIIPAIDIIEGKCVRLSQGDYNQKILYNENPLEVAKGFEDAGIQRLHLVDLDGAKAKHIVNHAVLETIASNTDLTIDFGGGLKSNDDVKIAFEAGASQITGGSIAANDRDTFLNWIETYGADRIILGADAKDGQIMISGWQEGSGQDIVEFIESYTSVGIKYIISTDVAKDGMLEGPNMDLYDKLLNNFPESNVIASGGVSGIEDIQALSRTKVYGVIVGKAIYEGRITLKELESFNAN